MIDSWKINHPSVWQSSKLTSVVGHCDLFAAILQVESLRLKLTRLEASTEESKAQAEAHLQVCIMLLPSHSFMSSYDSYGR